MTAGDPSVQWHLPPEWRAQLLDGSGCLKIQEWLSNGSAVVVKDAAHRTVCRIQVPGLDYFLKEYRAAGLRNRVRELLRPVKTKSEFDKARHLVSRGVAVPRPLGWGVLGSTFAPTASYIISETVPDSIQLSAIEAGQLSPAHRQNLARELGRFFAALHNAGVTHRDMHPGNLLLHWNGNAPEFTLIDLHEVRVRDHLSWQQRRDNLILLNRYYSLRATRSDRLRFWRAYEHATRVPDRPDATPAALEAATIRSNQRLWLARLNNGMKKIRSAAATGHYVAKLDAATLRALSTDPNSLITAESRMLKQGGRSTVVATPAGVIKRCNVRSPLDRVKTKLRADSASHSMIMARLLRAAGLPTPEPFAAVRMKSGENFLLAEDLSSPSPPGFAGGEGGVRGDYARFPLTPTLSPEAGEREQEKAVIDVREFVDRGPNQSVMRERIIALARALRQFHDRGFTHRDLKAPNLLTPANADDHRIWFVDLAGVRFPRRVSRERRIRDLGRLLASFLNHPNVTAGDRLRFLLAYRGLGIRSKAGWQRWWRELGERGEAIVADIRQRGRVVG